MYAVYHGPDGLTSIARRVTWLAGRLEHHVIDLGYRQTNGAYFDTLHIEIPAALNTTAERVKAAAERAALIFATSTTATSASRWTRPPPRQDVGAIAGALADAAGKTAPSGTVNPSGRLPVDLFRAKRVPDPSGVLGASIETEMMRYLKHLEGKDIGLDNR